MAESSFEQVLAERGELIYTNVGNSMYPLIKPRDLLVIKKTDGRLKRLDIPLYKRDSGRYILHRVIKVRADDYLLCGDNCFDIEPGITDPQILGVLTAVIRKEKTISVYSFRKRLYAHLWCDFLPLRRLFIRIREIVRSRIGHEQN